MKKSIITCVLLIVTYNSICLAQEKTSSEEESFLQTDDVEIAEAPNFYSKYFAEYFLTTNWKLRTENIQSNFVGASYIEMPLLMKHNFNDNINIFFGPKLDVFKDESSSEFSASMSFGLEYNVNKHLILEVKTNYLFTKEIQSPIFQTHYQYGSDFSFNFGSRYKF